MNFLADNPGSYPGVCGRMAGIDCHFRKNIGNPHGDPADGQRIIKSVFLQIL